MQVFWCSASHVAVVGLRCTAELAVNVMAAAYAIPVCECMVPLTSIQEPRLLTAGSSCNWISRGEAPWLEFDSIASFTIV